MESVPGARTVPQIVINGQLIGGFNELQQHLQNVEGGFGDGRL
jgi:glutaredoxin